jgi:hypothetical protein
MRFFHVYRSLITFEQPYDKKKRLWSGEFLDINPPPGAHSARSFIFIRRPIDTVSIARNIYRENLCYKCLFLMIAVYSAFDYRSPMSA